MATSLTFLGAAGTVTGSKYLVESNGKKVLVDAGLFQGDHDWRDRNWEGLPVDLQNIDAVLITHAHIDHIGLLPRLVRLGLKCPVYATQTTIELMRLLLLDSAHLQEEEVEYRRKKVRSRHKVIEPLYTTPDAESALTLLRPVRWNQVTNITEGISAEWVRAGHIIGAGSIRLTAGKKVIVFSGDVGRVGVPILKDPEPCKLGDLLLIESTYGDRVHPEAAPPERLAGIINDAVKRKGVVLIPSFAVGRCQLLLYYIRELKAQRLIPDIPVIIDSPMADDATQIYAKAVGEYDDEMLGIVKRGAQPFSFSKLFFTKGREDSMKLNSIFEPMIIIAASGMLTGGRILHHLRQRISHPSTTVLFVGFQPPGGRGAWIQSGAETVRIFKEELPIRAHIEEISALSAHGDREDLVKWCSQAQSLGSKPGKVAIVHGEPGSATSFAKTLKDQLGWDPFVARYQQKIEI